MTTCPKCQYQRKASDEGSTVEGVCPRCGIAYIKWKGNSHSDPIHSVKNDSGTYSSSTNISNNHRNDAPPPEFTVEPDFTLTRKLINAFTYTPDDVDSLTFYGRVIIFVVFFFWGWSFILGGLSWESIGGSFLHNVILPFHEFGHVFFSPFGRFMAILGGSLFQVLMPLGLMLAFVYQQKDTFAGSIMLWWCGQSFIDLSPYIADAPYRAIPLIAGMGEEAHDWGNLLTMMDKVDYAYQYAQTAFFIGSALIILSYIWGSYLLKRQKDASMR